ncbi:MAG: IPT/TIG domain-containing protein, partial [Micrococcales bacterium]
MIRSKFAKLISGILASALVASILAVGSPAQAAYLAPVIATVSPNSGTLTGGELITVTGANLQYVGGGALGNGIDQYHSVAVAPDGTWLQFRAPDASRTGKVDLSLYGQINVTEPQIYNYTATSITAINPPVGTFLGGTAVTITGVGFGPMEWGDGSLSVTIGGQPATAVHRVSPTQITAVTAPHALGVTDVVVSFNVVGNSIKYSNNVITGTGLYTYGSENVSPTITSISPDKGSIVGGQDVTISGKYLRGTDSNNGTFTFGGTTAVVKSVNVDGTSAVVTTPAHAAGQVDVTVTTADGTATLGAGYQYGPPPTVTGINASSGVTNGGTKVTITGTNFGSAGAPIVKIGGKLALCVKLVNSNTITAATRDNVAGLTNVEVTATTGAGSATLTNGYEFKAPATTPNITAITPNSGPIGGGTVVTFTTDGTFPTDTPNVMFGSVCAASVTRVNATTLRVTAPANPAGAKNVTLTWATAYATKSLGYTYYIPTPPVVSSVSPNIGWAVGGLQTTITGTGFGNVPGTLKFGTVTASTVTFWSDTMIIAWTPPNTVGAKDISVIPNLSTTPIVGSGLFTYKAPVISNVTPNNGPVVGGTAVTINGDGFGDTGTPNVTFGGKTASSIVRISPTKITAVVPSGTKGFARVVVTPDGGGAIANDTAYAYTNDLLTPLITDSSPWVGPQAGGITVTVTGKNFVGTDGRKGTLKINNAVPANVSINSGGTVATFTAPALGPGRYVISIVTNEGTAWQTLYTVFAKPSVVCADIYDVRNMNPDGGTLVRVYGHDMWHPYDADGSFPPTVKINGIPVEVTKASAYQYFGPYDTRRYFEFKDADGVLNGGYGYQSLTITAANETPITVNNCVYRTAGAAIIADDRTHAWTGVAQPFSYFGYHAVGERDGDKVVSVGTYTFSGNGYGPSTTPPTAVGEYTIAPSNATMDPSNHWNHYAFAYVSGTYTITGQPLTITATCSAPAMYDGTSASYTISGIPTGEVQKTATISWSGHDANGNSYGPTATAPKNAGTYTVSVSGMTFNSGMEVSYDFSYANTTCTIAKRPVQIVAKNQTKVFGDNDPALPWEFFDPANTNLVGTDSISGSLSRDKVGTHAGELVGLYEINTGNLSANNVNYDIQYSIPTDEAHPGEYGYLIITKKDITITAANKTKMYGNDDPRLTWTASPSSLTNGENVALGMTGSISRAEGQDVGTYTIGQGTLDNANYNITFVDGTFTITPRPIRVRFNDKSKVYGAAEKELTAYNEVRWNTSDLGLVYGDTIASIMTGTAARAVGENVGEYAITHDTMLSNANYTITWVNGKYTITPRPLHLDAADSTKVYGEADPTGMLDWTVASVAAGAEEGLVSPDTESIITGTAARQAGQDVGDYNITKGTLSAGSNYTLSFSTGKLTITKRPITIAPDAKSKVYGALNPTSYTYSVVSGSYAYSETSLVGNIAREWGEDVGDYGYILSWSFIYNNPNYSVTIDPTSTNKFSITKRDITITSEDKTKQYGQSDPEFSHTFTTAGLNAYGYLPNGQYVYFHGKLSRADREDVGAWDIEQG